MRREPRMYDGWLACPAAAESQLAMGENGREGVGAHDRRWRAAACFRLKVVGGGGRRAGPSIRRLLRGERYEFPTPHQPVFWVQDVAHPFEARRAEYASRRTVFRPRVRTNHTRAGVKREFDKCSGRFLGVSAPLVTRFHAVGDFNGPFRVWRALERASPEDHTGHGVDHGETMGPRTHRRAAKPREPVR